MSKTLFVFLFIFLCSVASAQKNIDGMIAAERAFAKYATDKNTKEAFLQFMDSAGVQFEEGKPIKSSEFWAKKEANTTRLKWWPKYAEIAGSNDFGYTTGPWTFQKTDADTVAAKGQYTTVWQMNTNGQWKFLVDYVNDYVAVSPATEVEKIKASKKNKGTLQSLVHAQELFNQLADINPQAAYQKYLSAQSILNLNGLPPLTKTFEQLARFNEITGGASFNIQGSGMATSGDMGFMYGTTTFKEKTNNYLHIWRQEKNGWKLAVVVVYL